MSGTVFDALSGCAVRSMWFLCGEAQGNVVPSLLHWPLGDQDSLSMSKIGRGFLPTDLRLLSCTPM